MEINKVYFSDVLDFIPRLNDSSIDLAIADPPYNLKKGQWDIFESEQAYYNFIFDWLGLLIPKLKPTASLYLFNTAFNSAIIVNFLKDKDIQFKNWITWYKFNYEDIRQPYTSTTRIAHATKKGIIKDGKRWFPNENGKLCNDVWEITSQRHKQKVNGKVKALDHPTVKPYEMIERMIKASSNEGNLVLDLFSGSGMTSIVSKALNRNFIGCERDKTYIDFIESEGIDIGRL